MMDSYLDISNSTDTEERWAQCLAHFKQQHREGEVVNRSEGRVVMQACIDVSTSMEGTKITAVKLGKSFTSRLAGTLFFFPPTRLPDY